VFVGIKVLIFKKYVNNSYKYRKEKPITDMNEKLVFLNVDGTILYNSYKVFESTIKAIERARENGHKIFLCTGRERQFIDKVLTKGNTVFFMETAEGIIMWV